MQALISNPLQKIPFGSGTRTGVVSFALLLPGVGSEMAEVSVTLLLIGFEPA